MGLDAQGQSTDRVPIPLVHLVQLVQCFEAVWLNTFLGELDQAAACSQDRKMLRF